MRLLGALGVLAVAAGIATGAPSSVEPMAPTPLFSESPVALPHRASRNRSSPVTVNCARA